MKTRSSFKKMPTTNSNMDVQIKLEDLNEDRIKSSILLHKTNHSKTATTKSGHSHRIAKAIKLKYVFIPLTKIKQQQQQQQPKTEEVSVNTPRIRSKRAYTYYKNEDIKALISYTIDDGMKLQTAAKKVNMKLDSATKYYRSYLKHPQHQIPTSQRSSNHPNLVFFNENYRYLKGLYDCDPGIKVSKLKRLLTAEFPHLNATPPFLNYIQQRMRDAKNNLSEPVLSHDNNSNGSKKLMMESHIKVNQKRKEEERKKIKGEPFLKKPRSEHTAFLKNLMETQPGLPIYKMRNRLVEKFPGLKTNTNIVSIHVRTHLSDLYQRTKNSKKPQINPNKRRRKTPPPILFPKYENAQNQEAQKYKIKRPVPLIEFNQEHKDFFETVLKEQPDISKPEIKASLKEKFPNLKHENSKMLSRYIEKYLYNDNDDNVGDDHDDESYQPGDLEEIKEKTKSKKTTTTTTEVRAILPILDDGHQQFLVDSINNNPYMSVLRLRWRLLERYPDLEVNYGSLAKYLRVVLKKPPTLRSKRRPQQKLTSSQLEFINNQVVKEKPNINIQSIFNTFVRTFPSYYGCYSSFSNTIRKTFPAEYQRRKMHPQLSFGSVFKPEHIEFVRNLFKNEDPGRPETIMDAYLATLRAFPDADFNYSAVQTYVFKMKL